MVVPHKMLKYIKKRAETRTALYAYDKHMLAKILQVKI